MRAPPTSAHPREQRHGDRSPLDRERVVLGQSRRDAMLDDPATVMAVSCITGSRLARAAVLRLAGIVPR
jgi:hypothetical protein